ncbi:T-cell surface glycoprotein CD3 zeta chain [Esox lucius]|uniref:T-cell surface glycoprotein CD3 zeta chain n=1 Tax=Esox lucius TaxID=8010 RepID=A0AAY5L1S5_ESOLU|nr:T-cell surface glycoprotein CD3 zeta chain [Esox lucius]
MDPQRVTGLLVLCSAIPWAEAMTPLYDPKLCYILDGFLLFYALFVTGLLLREKFFKTKVQGMVEEKNEGLYTDLNIRDRDGYGEIKRLDPERGQRVNRRNTDDTYTPLQRATDDTYKEITVTEQKRRRHKNDQVYQGLSSATKDTYDSLQMQPLPPPPR